MTKWIERRFQLSTGEELIMRQIGKERITWVNGVLQEPAQGVFVTDMMLTDRIFDGPDCYHWRKVFAWVPVQTISGKYVWLRKIYKRRFWAVWGTGFHMEPHVEYAELFDVLKQN